MRKRTLLALGGCLLFGMLGRPAPPGSAGLLTAENLYALERNNGCLDEATPALAQAWPDWAAAHIAGGDIAPSRVVSDPYPTMHSVAVDAAHDVVVMSDP